MWLKKEIYKQEGRIKKKTHRNQREGLGEHLFIVKKFVVSCTSPGLDIVELVEGVRLGGASPEFE